MVRLVLTDHLRLQARSAAPRQGDSRGLFILIVAVISLTKLMPGHASSSEGGAAAR